MISHSHRRMKLLLTAILPLLVFTSILSSQTTVQTIAHAAPFVEASLTPPFKFPSVEERIKYYMGSWYDRIKIPENICSYILYYKKGLGKEKDTPYIFDKQNLQRVKSIHYRPDALKSYIEKSNNSDTARFIFSFGDETPKVEGYPVIMKARHIQELHNTSGTPLLGYLATVRHFGVVDELQNITAPEWRDKNETLIWRGVSTGWGSRLKVVQRFLMDEPRPDVDIAFYKFVQGERKRVSKPGRYLKAPLSLEEQLQYKYLLSLEGNDVATGLKWMLYSNSVVFMPPPQHVTWAMEEMLVPFHHYIPITADGSDIPEKLEWAKANDRHCQIISKQATQFVRDLIVTEEAKATNDLILKGIVSRYEQLYGPTLAKCPKR